MIGLAQIGKAASCCSVANSCVRSAALAFVGFADFEHKGEGLSFSKVQGFRWILLVGREARKCKLKTS